MLRWRFGALERRGLQGLFGKTIFVLFPGIFVFVFLMSLLFSARGAIREGCRKLFRTAGGYIPLRGSLVKIVGSGFPNRFRGVQHYVGLFF